MQTVIRKWGNSLGIRIPKPFAEEVHLDDGNHVDINLIGKEIVIKPIKKKFDLNELLKQVNKNNLHTEISTGSATGKEIW